MPAYMIVTARISDRQAFIQGYGKRAAELVAEFGGRYVLRAPGAVALEGESGEGASVVISEWPDKAAALAFWNSPEYAEAKRLRDGLAECEVVLVESSQPLGGA
jgi:uncharacterized protein (DUF1330 family)